MSDMQIPLLLVLKSAGHYGIGIRYLVSVGMVLYCLCTAIGNSRPDKGGAQQEQE